MGLDTTHDAWHGAYSAFNRWRDKVAEAAGYTGHSDVANRTTIDIDWGCVEGVIGRELLLLAKAMHRVSDFLPDAQIHRAEGDCGGVGGIGSGEEWYLACAHCQVSPGGGKIGGAFQFARYKGL